MSKTCQIENCSCCFHKTENPEVVRRPRGRPVVPPVDEEHRQCRECNEIKELNQIRKGRNQCLDCYNKFQKQYYQEKQCYKKYKLKNKVKPQLVAESQPMVPDDLNLLSDFIA